MELLPNLKRKMINVKRSVDAQVEENFGYSPDCVGFDNTLKILRDIEGRVKELDPEWFKGYEQRYY